MKHQPFVTILLLLFVTLIACTNDKEEDLPGDPVKCDTTQVSYANDIAPIMTASCNNCHSATTPLGGVNTSDYAGLSVVAGNGKLKGAVNHLPGFSPMPQGQPQLDTCSVWKISAWVNQGFLSN